METIIYSNSKRQASQYQADKICLAQKVDISYLLHSEMYQYSIQNIHFWFVSDNLNNLPNTSTQQVLLTIGKNITNQYGQFSLEYLVEKYSNPPLNNTSPSTFGQTSKLSSSYQASRQSQVTEEQQVKSMLYRCQYIRQTIKFYSFKEFELFIFKEQQRRSIEDQDLIKTYNFKIKASNIEVSFISQHQKDLLQRIIDEKNDAILNAKIRNKKRLTLTGQHLLPGLPTFHNKLILYLFTQENANNTKTRLRTLTSGLKPNLSLEALYQWKIKDQQMDEISKLDKQSQILSQQIQNERLVFRQKIRCLQNNLGECINVDKLLFEEQEESFPYITLNGQKIDRNASFKQRTSNIKSMSTAKALGFQTSEFKRLKDISDSLKNIQNILTEQNKKIEQQKFKLKQLAKQKQDQIFKQARSANQVRNEIQEFKNQIKRKEMEIQEKSKNGHFDNIQTNKSKEPSLEAQNTLSQYSQFLKMIQKDKQIPQNKQLSQQFHKNNTLQVSPQTSRVVHKSLHAKDVSQKDTLLLRYRNRKLKEVQNNNQLSIQKQQTKNRILKKTYKKHFSLDYDLNQQVEQKKALNSQLLEQLVELYKYFNNNKTVIDSAQKDFQNYHILKNNKISFDQVTIEITNKQYPLLYKYIQNSQQNQVSMEQFSQKQWKEQIISIKKDCFDWAIGKQRRNIQQSIVIHPPNPVMPSKNTTSNASFKSELIDQILQNSPVKQMTAKKKSSVFKASLPRTKRMTIEETINLGNNPRFNSYQKVK